MTDQHDYDLFLKENGLTQKQVLDGLIASKVDWSPCDCVHVAMSKISGVGMHAGIGMVVGDAIVMIKHDDVWTLAGRFTNHSMHPNSEVFKDDIDGAYWLRAIRPISPGEEVTSNYRQVKQVMG